MKYLAFTICLWCCLAGSKAQDIYWQQQVNYTITAALNDTDHVVDGFVKIQYTNKSPDTLSFIWFHLWPNAYKNDRTAFSEQQIENGNTDFYFSTPEQKGYINQLDFRINDIHTTVEDHPQYIDVVKLILPQPLMPGATILITTPFHLQLPQNFSRGGHIGQSYQLTQWYPKPAVYDRRGWHPMPYLEQGEFYSEFGKYDVFITVPENYVVAATGVLQNEAEKEWLKTRASFDWKEQRFRKKIKPGTYKIIRQLFPPSSAATKTLHYSQDNIHDFAWFSDKRFIVQRDTCMLATGSVAEVYAYYLPAAKDNWNNAVNDIKAALRNYSNAIGPYPYPVVSVVEADDKKYGGMEYPTIAAVSSRVPKQMLAEVIGHEVGHNWLYGILASNERLHPWMDEGMNSYFGSVFRADNKPANIFNDMENLERIAFETITAAKKDQPVETPAPDFSLLNYELSAYYKAGEWMKQLKTSLGAVVFDSAIHRYYKEWQFRHPYPGDFKHIVETVSGKGQDSIFDLLTTKGSLMSATKKKTFRFGFIGKPDIAQQYDHINLAPALGYNYYDRLMIGGIIHNYTLPFRKLQFVAVPMYATGSKQFNAIGRATYTWYPDNIVYKAEAGLSFSKFTENVYTDPAGIKNYLGYSKLVPHIRLTFRNKDPRSQLARYVQLKSYFINEDALYFSRDTVTMENRYAVSGKWRTVFQWQFVTENSRALYPYRWDLRAEHSKDFMRLAFTGNYFFNYPNKAGLNVRAFAGKFIYLGGETSLKRSNTYMYRLNLSAPKGDEDYTYSNYFIGRNEYDGFLSQQVMIKDGGFKVATDLLSDKVGKTDDWLGALNFTSSFHPKIPLKLFLDIGTYSEAWKKDAGTSRVLFDAGIQLSLLKDVVNIYIPVLYSKIYRDYFRSYTENTFFQKISFSIDIQNLSFKKIDPRIPL